MRLASNTSTVICKALVKLALSSKRKCSVEVALLFIESAGTGQGERFESLLRASVIAGQLEDRWANCTGRTELAAADHP